MPRYRFAWVNFRPALLKKMASTLELEGAPADALQKKFGARPKADFVQSAWPVLRTVWLSADAASRQVVVDKLMSAGLGRFERTPHSKTAQLNYLDTCRNSPKLREIVSACRYHGGARGFSNSPRAGEYGARGFADHMANDGLVGWGWMPGGKREPGETSEAALVRELQEELGIEAEVGEKFFAVAVFVVRLFMTRLTDRLGERGVMVSAMA